MLNRTKYRRVPFSHSEVECNNSGLVKRLAVATSIELRGGLLGQQDVMASVEGFIGDAAPAVLDSDENQLMVIRAAQPSPMALHLVFRPSVPDLEPIRRPDPASVGKLLAEGTLSEEITFLGWRINTRALTIHLPTDKWASWTVQIRRCISARTVTKNTLSNIIGRFNHICHIIPDAWYFMNHLRRMEEVAKARGIPVILSQGARADLVLWIDFLRSAKEGILFEQDRLPDATLSSYSDSAEHGVAGHSPTTNVAWRHWFADKEQRSSSEF